MTRSTRWASLVIYMVCVALLTGSNVSRGDDSRLLCMTEMVSSIESSCTSPSTQGYYVVLEGLLQEYLSKCFQANFTQNRALHVMLPNISNSVADFLSSTTDQWEAVNGATVIDVVTTFIPAEQINNEVEFMLQHNQAISNDGWIMDPKSFGNVVGSGMEGLVDLTSLVFNDTELEWEDIVPFVRNVHATYGGGVYGMPVEANMNLFYYRKDLFTAFNFSAPQTWEDVVAIAAAWNITDLAERNGTDFGMCLEWRTSCFSPGWDIVAIAAPYLQSLGTNQGVYFDPTILSDPAQQPCLADNPAFRHALAIYANLSALNPSTPNALDACGGSDPVSLFSSGKCLMTLGYQVFMTLVNTTNLTSSQIGIIQTPGATQVYDRQANQMSDCTASLCPFAEPASSAADAPLINRAPFAVQGGWLSCVSALSPADYQNLSYSFLKILSTPELSWRYILDPTIQFTPFRTQHFTNLSRWVAAGFEANMTYAYLSNTLASLSSPNIVLDLRVAGLGLVDSIRSIYNDAAGNATAGVGADDIVSNMLSSMMTLLHDQARTKLSVMAATYATEIGYVAPPSPSPPPLPPGLLGLPPPSPSDKESSPAWLPVVIVLPAVAALLLIAAVVVYEVRNTRKHRNLWGKVLPPGPGPDTSILVAEVQDSAALWDQLGADVMDKVMQELHGCLFRLLRKYSGYGNNPAEGEGLVFAFHTLKDALLFAMEAQTLLLNAAWPAELLALPLCAPTYIQLTARDVRPVNLEDILDPEEVSAPAVQKPLSRFMALTGGGKEAHSPIIPALANVPSNETWSFAQACQHAWVPTDKTDPAKVLVFRGLSIQMGIHTGFHNKSDFSYSRVDNIAHYKGATVDMARTVASAASSGMVLVSEETYKKLPLERLWDKHLVLHVGEYRLGEGRSPVNLYHAMNRSLEGRLGLHKANRTEQQLDSGVFDAPVGRVTVAFMNVVGAQTLLSWNADVAQQALKIFHGIVSEKLKQCNGYLVEAVDGLFLAAFQSPADAIPWALECNEQMINQTWSEALLVHELCEELVISSPTKDGKVVNTVVFRGLRLKTGVDSGQVLGEVHAMTGRLTYRGKVMNRAARVASTASTGQVLCSSDAWATLKEVLGEKSNVLATSLGQFRLKGVSDKIEIFHCRKATTSARRTSVVMAMSDPWKWDQPRMVKALDNDEIVLDNVDDADSGINDFLAVERPLELELDLGLDDDDDDDDDDRM